MWRNLLFIYCVEESSYMYLSSTQEKVPPHKNHLLCGRKKNYLGITFPAHNKRLGTQSALRPHN